MRTAFSSVPIRMRPNSWFRAAVFIAALFAPAPARSDPVERYATSSIGSERLRLFAVSRMFNQHNGDPRVVSMLRADLARQGFYYDGKGSRLISRGFWISPRIGHDSNINGGSLNDRFGYGGLVFEADPAMTAKSGWVGGFALGQGLRLAVANGTFLDLSGRGELEYSPKHRIGTNRARVSACLRHNVGDWTFVDLCRDVQDSERKLGRSHLQTTGLTLSRMTETDRAYHELTAKLERSDYGYINQTGIALGVRSAFDRFTSYVSVSFAEPVAGEMAFRQRVDAGISLLWKSRAYGMNVWAQEADGGRFLGEARRDLNVGLGASIDLSQTTSIDVSYTRNMSNHQFFDSTEISLAISLRHFSW